MHTLYIQRHGQADSPAGGGERILTHEGERLLHAAAQGLRAAGLQVSAIAHSPLARTRQTAELMRPCLAPGAAVVACPCLAPSSEPGDFLAWRRAHLPASPILWVVAHMPEVAMWTQLWSNSSRRGMLSFAPGSVVRLRLSGELAPGAADLRWLQTAEALAAGAAEVG